MLLFRHENVHKCLSAINMLLFAMNIYNGAKVRFFIYQYSNDSRGQYFHLAGQVCVCVKSAHNGIDCD